MFNPPFNVVSRIVSSPDEVLFSVRELSKPSFTEEAIQEYMRRDALKNKRQGKTKLPRLSEEERKQQWYENNKWRKLVKQKLTSIFGLIYDGLTLSSKLLFINVAFRLPTTDEINVVLEKHGMYLGAMDTARLTQLANNNKVMERFRRRLDKLFADEDKEAARLNKRIHKPNVFVVWVREYGSLLGRRHYHMLICINGHREHSVGPYKCRPSYFGNLGQRIANCWLEVLGLDTLEFTLTKGRSSPLDDAKDKKLSFGWLVFYPGNKTGRKATSNNIYKSRLVKMLFSVMDMDWIYKVVSYMLKKETKAIPEEKRKEVKETERTFGCSRQFVL